MEMLVGGRVKERKKVLTDFERHMGWMQDVRAAKRNMIK